MNTRPLPVTIIAWFLVVTAAFTAHSVATLPANPLALSFVEQSGIPVALHMTMGFFGAMLSVVCGWGMLKGKGWSRLAYLGWSVVGSLIGFVTSPYPSIAALGLAFTAVTAFFLYRPAANPWFGKPGLEDGADAEVR